MSLSIPQIKEDVAADFLARGISAEVLFGDWNAPKHAGANRVLFGLGDFAGDAPGPHFAPGAIEIPGTDTAARAMDVRVQDIKVWVHAAPPPDPKTPKRSELAQEAAAALLHATVAALRRVIGAPFPWSGKWPTPERAEFLYGSLATFTAKVRIPVLDDALGVAEATEELATIALEVD